MDTVPSRHDRMLYIAKEIVKHPRHASMEMSNKETWLAIEEVLSHKLIN
jgi:hypothetical protein